VITVLIPCKHDAREDWLNEAIASVPKDTPYILLRNDGELADALNQGLAAATTKYVVRLDADDFFEEDAIKHLLDAAWDADVVYPTLVLCDEELKWINDILADEFCANRLTVNNFVAGAGTLFDRELAIRAGGFREMAALEDYDLWVRMLKAGARFKAAPESRYAYRQVAGSRNKIAPELGVALKDEIVGERPELASTFYTQETVAQTYWRCLLPARYLPAQVVRRPIVTNTDDWFDFPEHRGVAVWAFPGHEHERWWMAAMQENGIPVMIETDDNYLTRIPYGGKWAFKSSQSKVLPSIERHRQIAGWCDGVIVTTEHLAKQYRKVTEAPVFVCPNQIDPADWVTDAPMPDWYDADKTYVGFAASASHLHDVKLVRQGLEWCSKQRGVEVVVFGVPPLAFKGMKFRWVPWTSDISAYRALQRVIDIGVAPIVENPWSVCRSDLKALEYAMVGACPVLSDAIPYRGWTDGEGCRKATDARDFTRVLRELVNDPGERKRIADDAGRIVLADRTVSRNVHLWRDAIDEVKRVAA